MNRAKEEIIKSILEALPDYKTRIMQKTNMEWRRINRYLDHLDDIGLLDIGFGEHYPHRPTYELTERGKQYLAAVNELLVLSECGQCRLEGSGGNAHYYWRW